MNTRKKYFTAAVSLFCACVTALLVCIIFTCCQIAPFGQNTLAVMDGDIQYLDLFNYYKDCLAGQNSLIYTFSKGLGGGMLSDFAFYLTSPINLLVLAFDKSRMPICFDIIVALKLCVAAITASIYLQVRFKRNLSGTSTDFTKYVVIIVASVAYSLCQYCIGQSSNIMWLDGVYMLPLVLLFSYRCATDRKIVGLSITAGITVIFNWYTGVINCLFAVAYFVLECILQVFESNKKQPWKFILRRFGRFCIAMAIAVVVVAILMLPIIKSMLGQSSGGRLYIKSLFNPKLDANPLAFFTGLGIGAMSSPNYPALFCGGLILALNVIFVPQVSNRKIRTTLIIAAVIGIMAFYWHPVVWLFSLCVKVSSYWFRYAYTSVLLFIFIGIYAAFKCEKLNIKQAVLSVAIFAAAWIASTIAFNVADLPNSAISIALFVGISASIIIASKVSKNSLENCLWVFIAVVCACFLVYNGNVTLPKYRDSWTTVSDVANYTNQETDLISTIHNSDTSNYRITQNSSRSSKTVDGSEIAKCNESLAFNFWGDATYTSNSDSAQNRLLKHCGYSNPDELIQYSDTSIIPVQSLIGAKYILSKEMPALCKQTELNSQVYGDKKIFENTNAFPLAFTCTSNAITASSENPLEYINELYKQLFGSNASVYTSDVIRTYETSKDASLLNKFDATALLSCAEKANSNAVQIEKWQNGHIKLLANTASKDQLLYVSIPHDNQWKITVNGHEATYDLLGNCLYLIHLDPDQNEIVMNYELL